MSRRIVACLLLAAGVLAPTPCLAQGRIGYFGGYRYSGSASAGGYRGFDWASYPYLYYPGVYGPGNGVFSNGGYVAGTYTRYYPPVTVFQDGTVLLGEPPVIAAEPRPDNTARLRLIVPENAQLWFDGQKTQQTGTERSFSSPPLTPSTTYAYSVRIRYTREDGRVVDETRSIEVRANESWTVDFTQPALKASLSPSAPTKR